MTFEQRPKGSEGRVPEAEGARGCRDTLRPSCGVMSVWLEGRARGEVDLPGPDG